MLFFIKQRLYFYLLVGAKTSDLKCMFVIWAFTNSDTDVLNQNIQ